MTGFLLERMRKEIVCGLIWGTAQVSAWRNWEKPISGPRFELRLSEEAKQEWYPFNQDVRLQDVKYV
jgi:hypothetical protein